MESERMNEMSDLKEINDKIVRGVRGKEGCIRNREIRRKGIRRGKRCLENGRTLREKFEREHGVKRG